MLKKNIFLILLLYMIINEMYPTKSNFSNRTSMTNSHTRQYNQNTNTPDINNKREPIKKKDNIIKNIKDNISTFVSNEITESLNIGGTDTHSELLDVIDPNKYNMNSELHNIKKPSSYFTELKTYESQFFDEPYSGEYSDRDIDIRYYNQLYNMQGDQYTNKKQIGYNNFNKFRNTSKNVDIDDLMNDMGSDGDNKLANRMKVVSLKNKEAIKNRARFDRYTNQHYFTEELNNHANSIWWENQDYENIF